MALVVPILANRVMVGWTSVGPQLVAMVPWLTMTPLIVPQPSRVALLEIIRLLANEWMPPFRCNFAAATPLPTTNGAPLATIAPLVLSVPPLKMIVPAALVSKKASAVIVPPFKVRLPFTTLMTADPTAFVTAILPPVTDACPVEKEAAPTNKFDDEFRLPPATVSRPLEMLVGSAATNR